MKRSHKSSSFRTSENSFKKTLSQTTGNMKGKVNKMQRQVTSYVKKNPIKTIGVSIGVSMLAGALIGGIGGIGIGRTRR